MSRRRRLASSPKRRRKCPRKRTKVFWGIALLSIATLSVVLALRWQAWFGNRPELPYSTPDTIDRITLTTGQHFDSERTVSWRCGEELRDSWLEYTALNAMGEETTWYSLPARGVRIETRSGKGCFYTASIHGLKAGHSYLYRVKTGAQQSPIYRISMPSRLDSVNRFVYIGDVQDQTGEMSLRLFSILRDSVAPAYRPHFVAGVGDQIDGPADEYWTIWYRALGQWPATMPMLFATGNHEYLKRGFMRELDPRWVAQYNFPDNGPEGFERRSYYVDLPLMRFIVLDTNDINDVMAIVRHRSWLASALRSSGQPWQVVMFHHAIKCVREGRRNLVMSTFFRSILEDNGADLVLQGHDHAYSRITTKAPSGALHTPMYVISTSSPKLYANEFDPVHDRLGSGLQLYQLIDVHPDHIRYRSYQYSGALYDEVAIHHAGQGASSHRIEDRAEALPELFLYDQFRPNSKGQRQAEAYRQAVEERRRDRANRPSSSKKLKQ